ncbi:MAG TPA: peptidylprolyl isomerase [Solirubrobacteraceae bacterium]|nr:peptidylprolyl isomerase [Solirubrobacteraceae bacterium]
MRRANVLIVILLASLALVLIACGKDTETTGAATQAAPATTATAATTATTATTATATTAKTTTAAAAAKRADGCTTVPTPQPAADPNAKRSKRKLDPKRVWFATIRTNCGTIKLRLAVGRAPKTTSAWAGLARAKFFDGLTFHRIAKPGGNDFVIQGGDPEGTGNGGPGYSVVEAPPKNTKYTRYVAAMAKTATEAAGTSGSQFFIVTAPDAGLPPDYAVLGEVVGSKAAVKRIAAVPTDPSTEAPLEPVVMQSVRITSTAR